MIRQLLLVFSILIFLPLLSAKEIFDHEIDLRDERVAQFRLWLPSGIEEPRAVITLAPGLQGDARNQVLDAKWQELATRHNVALLGLRLREPDRGYYYRTWAFDAIDTALRDLGRETRRGELRRAPLLMWGHSAGGQLNYSYAGDRPRRVSAFVVNKGVSYPNPVLSQTRRIPALFFIGGKDSAERRASIEAIHEEGHRRNAPWALIVEPDTGHGVGESKDLTIAFFDAVLSDELEDGWVGDLQTGEISHTPGIRPGRGSTWLPNKAFALRWRIVSGDGLQTGKAGR